MQDMEPACLAIHRGMQRGKGVWAHESQRGSATIESSCAPQKLDAQAEEGVRSRPDWTCETTRPRIDR